MRMVRGIYSREVYHYKSDREKEGNNQECSKPCKVPADEGESKSQQEAAGRRRNKWGRHSSLSEMYRRRCQFRREVLVFEVRR
jgi:hypothetical protein